MCLQRKVVSLLLHLRAAAGRTFHLDVLVVRLWEDLAVKGDRRSVFYVDDQEGHRIRFKQRHADKFDIKDFEDPVELLEALKESHRLPDLVLLDLYYPHKRRDKKVQEDKENQASHELAEFNKGIARLKKAVDDAWQPDGLFWLAEIRKVFPSHKLPVLVYTQRGLLLLEDSQLSEIEENGADWLVKDTLQVEKDGAPSLLRTTETTEARRIAKFIDISRASRSQRMNKVKIAIVSAVLGALVSCFLDWMILSCKALFRG